MLNIMTKKSNKKKSKFNNHSKIPEHKFHDKKLIPPLMQVPGVSLVSWCNDRLPCMIWAILIVCNADRDVALALFKEIADYFYRNRDTSKEKTNFGEVTIVSLSKMEKIHFENIVQIVTRSQFLRQILRPLLLFDSLPGKEVWANFISDKPIDSDWLLLMKSVAKTLDHQSQESTDCRWLRVICLGAAGRLILPYYGTELAAELTEYPRYGDMRKVRPSIRSIESSFSELLPEDGFWSKYFWKECLLKTSCYPLPRKRINTDNKIKFSDINDLHKLLSVHFIKTQETTAIDAKHDAVFGFAFYSLRILGELLNLTFRTKQNTHLSN